MLLSVDMKLQTIGRYRIDALIGTGAMGEVYRAYDPVIDRPVAIKVVRPELISGEGFRAVVMAVSARSQSRWETLPPQYHRDPRLWR